MTCSIEVQKATEVKDIPDKMHFIRWVETVFNELDRQGDVLIRLVDEAESTQLNETYRHKTGPTNVLSFPFEAPAPVSSDLLGDLIICAPVVAREAQQQQKTSQQHWAHIVIHGVLHLLGYDHIDEDDARQMETLEIRLLEKLNIPNPYHEDFIHE